MFPNIDTIASIKSPVFIMHGTHDVEISIEHGIALHSLSNKLFEPWWVEGAGHNDIEISFRDLYMFKLRKFLTFLSTSTPHK